ncbi:MAG: anthranilate synthase component I [Firmicutes bacterium]|nr:anthranilate synthase component I [Bacillota bacterium]
MYRPDEKAFVEQCRESDLIPVYSELVCDMETPISVYQKLRDKTCGFLLESVEGGERLGRYSFLGFDPFITVRGWGSKVEIDKRGGKRTAEGNPLEVVRGIMRQFRVGDVEGLPRFFGGAVGYMSYDLVRFYEALPGEVEDDMGIPDCFLVFPEVVVVFDHVTHKIKVIVNAVVNDRPPALAYRAAVARISEFTDRIRNSCEAEDNARHASPAGPPAPGNRALSIHANMEPGSFMEMVRRAKDYIAAGEIFQVVLSQRFHAEASVPPFEVYRALRSINPSPYMFFMDFDGISLVGSSPEMLVRLEHGVLETRPIAGTRPRGDTPEADRALERELLADEKERAEHVMLVDLGRNDLGRVCEYGSVEVPEFMTVERYSHVMHILSGVRGRLATGRDAFDAFAACFPAGTVSGAPKVRAMEIIDKLEPTKRGPYAGAVGYFGFLGNMDTCITIRTIVFSGGKAYFQAGAGIVADSDPEREYQECVNKAKALLRALEVTGEGLI